MTNSNFTSICNNSVSTSFFGIELNSSDNNSIVNNSIASNDYYGLDIESLSNNNLVWGNNLFNSHESQTRCNGSLGNQWSFQETGNYYGDYINQNPTATNDGRVWNISYQIPGNSNDNDSYPLVGPIVPIPQNILVLPSITHPSDQLLLNGSTGNKIKWTITDPNPTVTQYWIYENGTLIQNNTWISNIPINLSIDGLSLGGYNFSIIAVDGSGGIVTDTVIVNVVITFPTSTTTSTSTSSTPPFSINGYEIPFILGLGLLLVVVKIRRIRSFSKI